MTNAPILALDPGTSFLGWCRSDGVSGTLRLKDYADKGEAICSFQRWFAGQCAGGLSAVIIERPCFTMRATNADIVHGIIWSAHALAYQYNVPRREMRADTIRKALLGRARRMKGETVKDFDLAIRAAVVAMGYCPNNEHEADAAALLCVQF